MSTQMNKAKPVACTDALNELSKPAKRETRNVSKQGVKAFEISATVARNGLWTVSTEAQDELNKFKDTVSWNQHHPDSS